MSFTLAIKDLECGSLSVLFFLGDLGFPKYSFTSDGKYLCIEPSESDNLPSNLIFYKVFPYLNKSRKASVNPMFLKQLKLKYNL
jgi:hypothetical protein